MRIPIYGRTIPDADISISETGAGLAAIYSVPSGGSTVSSISADSQGNAVFYYDDSVYPFPAFFDLTITKTGYETITRSSVWNFFDTYGSLIDIISLETAIANRAIVMVGGRPISSFADATDTAMAVSRLYTSCRDAVLRAYPWNCAMAYATLTLNESSPEWGYEYRYYLPSDCLRVLGLDVTSYIYKISGRYLFTNDVGDELNIRYTKKETDPTIWDPLLTEAIVVRLSAELAVPITGDKALAKLQWELYERILREARSIDGQEGSADSIESNDLVDFRR